MNTTPELKDAGLEQFLTRIENQKRNFILFLGGLVFLVSIFTTTVRFRAGLYEVALSSLLLLLAAVATLPLAWKKHVNLAAHILLIVASVTIGFNQYGTRSASLGPILNVLVIFAGGIYLLSLRWGIVYGAIGVTRAFGIKILQDNGILQGGSSVLPASEWYSAVAASYAVCAYLLIVRDRNSAEMLERYQRAANIKQRFIAEMSHEIRTPLNGLIGLGEVLASKITDPEQLHYLNTMLNSGKTLLRIANQALDLSRVESGNLVTKRNFSPVTLLEEIIALYSVEARRKNITLALQVEPGTPGNVFGAADSIAAVLTNLLQNAIKFTDAGSITMKVDGVRLADENFAVFTVADTGRGIPESEITAVFEPYNQGGVATPTAKGAGLGLAICRELTRQMEGNLEVQSTFGSGSVFTLRVPYEAEIISAQVEKSVPDGTYEFPRALKILSVDDDAVNQMVMSALLADKNVNLSKAMGGLSALAMVAAEKPDIILMDLNMPDLSGFEVLRRIRQAENSVGVKPCPVVAVSASVMPEEIGQALAAGFSAHLGKPLSKADLWHTIVKVLSPLQSAVAGG